MDEALTIRTTRRRRPTVRAGMLLTCAASALLAGRPSTAWAESPAPPSPEDKALLQQAEQLANQIHEDAQRTQTQLETGDLERAKDSQTRQTAATQRLSTLQALPANQSTADQLKTVADKAASEASASEKTVNKATSQSGCGGKSKWCLFGGALVGSYSLTVGWGDRSGQTGHHVISLLVPSGGVRRTVFTNLSIDLGAYTAIISPEFQPNAISTAGSGCSTGSNKFTDMLPCEGDTALRPYGALLLGATIGTGNSSLGIITIGYTVGVARTTQDGNAFWFEGLMVGTGGIYGTVSP